MKKTVKKLLSLLLIFSFVIVVQIPVLAKNVTESTATGTRTNLVFQEGRPGDAHLVYTYDQDNKSFKVEENFSDDLTNGNSTVYVKNSDGNYVVFSTQKVSTTSNGDLNITITDIKKSIEKHVIPANTVSKKIAPKVTIDGDEWITLYRSGSTNIKNFTINAIIAACGAIATYYCSSAGGQTIIAGLTSLATSLFNYNVTTAYYNTIYNWRNSPRNWLVIDETEWTDWYSDSAHNNWINYTYYGYIY